MKILVIGSGAREHALTWKISQSKKVSQIYVAPGNAGTAAIARNLPIKPTNIAALSDAVQEFNIDLTMVGSEAPLAAGIVDLFEQKRLPIVGPTKNAAQIESSKVFAKELMQEFKIPTARGEIFSSYAEARKYIESQKTPLVIKADGLAAGKGVIIASSREEAIKALTDMMETKIFGAAGDRVVIEECLIGKEVSLLAFTDGKTVVPMVPACDYKRAYDNDLGPNTGGMGSYSPPGFFDAGLSTQVKQTIIETTVAALAKKGTPYKGVLYTGLMLTDEGPKVLEFNARFGDPETQVILPRLKSDLVDIFSAIADNKLSDINVEWDNKPCVGVVMASGGYPGNYLTGFPISGLDAVNDEIIIFHAGTKKDNNSKIVTDGGRVLTVVTTGNTIGEARETIYRNMPLIKFNECYYRKDIAAREVA